MVSRLRFAMRFIASPVLAAFFVSAIPGSSVAAKTPLTLTVINDAQAEVDRYLFEFTLKEFSEVWDLHQGAGVWQYSLDWSSDQCSKSPDQFLGFNFMYACKRHDFGYRNYKNQARLTEDNRHRIDSNFRSDMYEVCRNYKGWWFNSKAASCRKVADGYYHSVRQIGNKKLPSFSSYLKKIPPRMTLGS